MSVPLENPDIRPVEEGFVFTWPLTAVNIELTRFTDKRGELRAEATISRVPAGAEAYLLHEAEINLLSTTTRNQLVKYLAEQQEGHDVPWLKLLEHLCFLAKRRYREGTPSIHQRDIIADNRPRFALRPYVEYGRATVLFGPGGSTKTYAAIAAATSWATGLPIFGEPMEEPGPVMFLDWETDAKAFKRRLMAIRRGHGVEREPDIYYRKIHGPFIECARAVQMECKQLGVRSLVSDSLGKMVGGELVDPRFVLPCFDAIDRFELPTLIVSHVNADTVKNDGNGHLMPYGSAYTENSAGNTFSIRNRAEQGAPTASIFIRHEKVNDGAKVPDHGYTVTFTNFEEQPDLTKSVEYESQDVRRMPAFQDKLSVSDRLVTHLTHDGPAHLKVVAEATGIPEGQLNARARDLVKRLKIVQLPDRRYAALDAERVADA